MQELCPNPLSVPAGQVEQEAKVKEIIIIIVICTIWTQKCVFANFENVPKTPVPPTVVICLV